MGTQDGAEAVDQAAETVERVKGTQETTLWVKNTDNTNNLAGAISHGIADGQKIKLRAIGAGAVNQAVKACAAARGIVATRGVDLSFRPGFELVEGTEREVTAIVIFVEAH